MQFLASPSFECTVLGTNKNLRTIQATDAHRGRPSDCEAKISKSTQNLNSQHPNKKLPRIGDHNVCFKRIGNQGCCESKIYAVAPECYRDR